MLICNGYYRRGDADIVFDCCVGNLVGNVVQGMGTIWVKFPIGISRVLEVPVRM